MGAPAFTPGPWEVKPAEEDKPYIRVRGTRLGERYKIANVLSDHPVGNEASANARLIAAAPELYAKAEHLLDMIDAQERVYTPKPTRESEDDANSRDEGDQVFGNAVEALRASLAKARGEQVAK